MDHNLKLLWKKAKTLNIKLEAVSADHFQKTIKAGFSYQDFIIRYNENILSEPLKATYIIAHELGHALDFLSLSSIEQASFLEIVKIYNFHLLIGENFPHPLSQFILSSEKLACFYAQEIFQELNIKILPRQERRARGKLLNAYRLMLR